MRGSVMVAAFAALVISSVPALAQQGTASPGPGAAPPSAGPGPRAGGGPRVGRNHTPGWGMMTRQERDELHQRLRGTTSPEECRQVMDEHRKLMAERAQERGLAMRAPRHDPCAAVRG